MKNLTEIKIEKQSKIDALINEVQMFFAFSTEQFNEGKIKTPLKEGDKYLSLGAGCFMPKSNYPIYSEGIKTINKWYKQQTSPKNLRRENIVYELINHEAFYTNDISDTLETLGSDYTYAEVWEVYINESKKQAGIEY